MRIMNTAMFRLPVIFLIWGSTLPLSATPPLAEVIHEGWTSFTAYNHINIVLDSDNVNWFDTTAVLSRFDDNTITVVETEPKPEQFPLSNFPNPFNPSTTLSYRLAEAGPVKLMVYNLAGQLVETLVDKQQPAGHHAVAWRPDGLARGVYVYRVEIRGYIGTGKMLYMK